MTKETCYCLFTLQVIVTVPLLLLKKGRLKFTPDLPTRKQTAISNLGAGLIEKVYQCFCCSTQTLIHVSQTVYFRRRITFSPISDKFQTQILDTNEMELIKLNSIQYDKNFVLYCKYLGHLRFQMLTNS